MAYVPDPRAVDLSSDESFVDVDVTREDGTIVRRRTPMNMHPAFDDLQGVAVSDSITQLTRMTHMWLDSNAFSEFPTSVLVLTQLTYLAMITNRLVAVPREIARLTALTQLWLPDNQLVTIPREIGQLRGLTRLVLHSNLLTAVPSELGDLQMLEDLQLSCNELTWLPIELGRLPATTKVSLNGNPLPIYVGEAEEVNELEIRQMLPDLFAATTALAMIRESAFVILTALQELFIPALLLVKILDAAFPNSIPMYKKWDLVVAVRHFHQRRGIER